MRYSILFAVLLALIAVAACQKNEEKPAAIRGAINVVEATYGWSCKDFQVPKPAVNSVRRGNATTFVSKECDGKSPSCPFAVDVNRLGDPATTCVKDFTVRWRCGADPAVHEAALPSDAQGKTVTLACSGR